MAARFSPRAVSTEPRGRDAMMGSSTAEATPSWDASAAAPELSGLPLCVHLEGGVVRTDVGIESLIALLKRNVLYLLLALLWLCRGRAVFKDQVARRSVKTHDPEL